jgi:hypothetical protein
MNKMGNLTEWQHYKKNYLAISIVFVVGGIFAGFTIEQNAMFLSFVMIIIGAVVIPIGNRMSYKSKFKK